MKPFILLSLAYAGVRAWQCDSVELDDHKFDLSRLNSEYVIETSKKTPPTITHTTFSINPCSALPQHKDVKKGDQCPPGSQVCRTTAIEKDDVTTIIEVLAFAAEHGTENAPNVTRIPGNRQNKSNGFRLSYTGAEDGAGEQLSSIIDFLCQKSAGDGEPTLSTTSDEAVAHFEWETELACTSRGGHNGEPRKGGPPGDRPPKRSSWGFFTWVFLIVFMTVASFLIFTLFLNYNRYGQVGLDLVPAMDSVKVSL